MYRFLIVYLRNIKNNPRLFLINIASFSIGIVAVMFITLYVVKEFNTDKFHSKHRDIYRVLENRTDAPERMSDTCYPMGNLLKTNHGEIEDYTRFLDSPYYNVKIDDKQFLNQKISFVDASFFKMFDFRLDAGDYTLIFKTPNTVIIDKETAERYFGTIDVLGKVFEAEIPEEKEKSNLTIVGILSDYPEESTLQPHIVTDIKRREKEYLNNYFVSSPQLFLYIPHCADIHQLSENLAQTYYSKLNELRTVKYPIDRSLLNLQPLDDLYLHSSNVSDRLSKGDYTILWILMGVGFILLIITFINYIILNVGLSLKHQKQNQINRILGGSSGWLRKKYIAESVFYTFITFFISLLLLPIVHKIITRFSDYRYSLFSKSDQLILLSFFIGLIVLGILSGLIQYAVIEFRKKSEIELVKSANNPVFFRYLVPFQLFVFISILTSLLVITRQLSFIRAQDMGYDVENSITVQVRDYDDMKLFVQEFSNINYVNAISVGHNLFRDVAYLNKVTIDNSLALVNSQCIFGDQNYIDAYKIKLLAGTNIDGDKLPPVDESYRHLNDVLDILVNEEFVKKSGLKDPLGTIITIDHNGISKGRITGIIQDVKNLPFYHSITPIVIGYGLSHGPSLIVSVKEGKMADFKKEVTRFFKKIGKESYFGYDTYSYDFDEYYKKEELLMHLLSIFSFITFFILILGLIGISLFLAEQKTKEIGIRKVNGAKVYEILSMLNKNFVKWTVIAFLIAAPVSYYAMNKWLENFAYKTSLSWWIFALAGLLALGIALLTVSWQSWKAATRNPVEALRYE
jgi:putative ABC transport system permease protein